MTAEQLRTVAVIGAGQMGAGITEVFGRGGFEVRLCDIGIERAEAALDAMFARLLRLVQRGKLTEEELSTLRSRIRAHTLEQAATGAHLAIEAVSESSDLKARLFREVDALLPESALFASNTSSISITWLAAQTKRADRVVGMHFMNPVPLMKLVELVSGLQTSAATLAAARKLAEQLGKTVIVSRDRPGFLVNRILIPFLNEACITLEAGVGTAEDIDQGARLGLNHPMGPLELADLIGLDTVLAISEVLHRELGEDKYRPAPLLRTLVAAGWFGRKSGRGFFEYGPDGKKLTADRRAEP